MVDHPLDDLIRHGCDMAARPRGLQHVRGIADGCRDDLGFDIVNAEDLHDLLHEVDALLPDVVKASDEGADVRRPRACGEERLRGGKDQRDVGLDAERGQSFGRLETLCAHGDLDDKVLAVDLLAKRLRLRNHGVRLQGNDLRADGTVDDFGDLLDDLDEIASLARDERGVGGHAADHAQFGGAADLLGVGGINKKLHNILLFVKKS